MFIKSVVSCRSLYKQAQMLQVLPAANIISIIMKIENMVIF